MTLKIDRYIRKIIFTGGIQVSAENIEEVSLWCRGDIRTADVPGKGNENGRYVKVRVHHPKSERYTKAFIGDWVVYANGSYTVYSDRAFRATFDSIVGLNGFTNANKKTLEPSLVESTKE